MRRVFLKQRIHVVLPSEMSVAHNTRRRGELRNGARYEGVKLILYVSVRAL